MEFSGAIFSSTPGSVKATKKWKKWKLKLQLPQLYSLIEFQFIVKLTKYSIKKDMISQWHVFFNQIHPSGDKPVIADLTQNEYPFAL